MEESTICKANFCELCHDQFMSTFQDTHRNAPRYAQPTEATVRRVIATRLSSPRKSVSLPLPTKQKHSFEALPAEIRLQIYRACLRPPSHPSQNVSICGWTKGGGLHADRNPYLTDRYRPLMKIRASHGFPRALLMLNKRIYSEAIREIYGMILFQLAGTTPSKHIPQLKWWLTTHPMRLATCIELPMRVLSGIGLPNTLRKTTLTISDLKDLAAFLSGMPNLKQLNVMLTFIMVNQDTATALRTCLAEGKWQKRLLRLRKNVPKVCKTTVVLSIEDRFGIRSDDQNLESAVAKLNTELEGFNVRRRSTSDLSQGFLTFCWCIEVME